MISIAFGDNRDDNILQVSGMRNKITIIEGMGLAYELK